MLKFFKQRIFSKKLKTYLITSFMVTNIVILLILSTIYYSFASKILLTQSEQAILRSLKQLEYNIDLLLDNMNNVSKQILVSAYFSQGMDIDSLSTSSDVKTVNEVYSYFSSIMNNYSYIDSIFYYGDNGTIIGCSNSDHLFENDLDKKNFFYQSDLYKAISKSKKVTISGIYSSYDFFESSSTKKNPIHYISMARSIRTLGHTTGSIIINIKESYLRSVYHNDSINSEGESFLLDQNDVIISAEDKSFISSKADIRRNDSDYSVEFLVDKLDNKINNTENQIICYPYDRYNLSIIYEIPYHILLRDIQNLKEVIEILFVLSIITALITSLFWIYKITRPLENLLYAMHTMGEGNIGLKLNENVKSELGILGKQFNRMSANIMELVEENKRIQEERHKLEMQNLQNQINPHFLYNTLNTIKWMAIVSKADNISNCITALGNMLKPIYSNKEVNWNLSDEITYLKNYICIMNYRFGNSIEFTEDIPEDILQINMPKFILQPIIENSIIHSNPLNDIKNVITIHAVLSEGYILISISDVGVGIPSTKLISIQNLLQQANLAPGETDTTVPLVKDDTIGIGLINIHKRIRLQFGSDCGLSISSFEGLGTTITIRIK